MEDQPSSSSSPCQHSSSSGQTFEGTLPPEIWQLILAKVRDPQTLLNCCMTCSSWNDLVLASSAKSEFLFPLVIPHLTNGNHIQRNEVFNLRLVCSTWKTGVDQFLQKFPPTWDPHFGDLYVDNEFTDVNEPADRYGQNAFVEPLHFQQFLDDMKDVKGNPFPKRKIIFAPTESHDENYMNQLYTGFVALLEKFGKHIWTFVYICNESSVKAMNYFQYVFQLMPNVKSLKLYMHHSWGTRQTREGLVWLTESESPLPPMSSLVSLSVSGSLAEVILDPLMERYGNQLEHLVCDEDYIVGGQYFRQNSVSGEIITVPELQTLAIRNRDQHYRFLLESLIHCRMPRLEKLAIEFRDIWLDTITQPSLLRGINPFAQTLVELHIPVENKQLERAPDFNLDSHLTTYLRDIEPEFPLLKTLGVAYSILKTEFLVQILRKFPSLRRLEFHGFGMRTVHSEDEDTLEEINISVPFAKSYKQMYSFIEKFWNLVPTLQEILIMHRFSHQVIYYCSREGSQPRWTKNDELHFSRMPMILE